MANEVKNKMKCKIIGQKKVSAHKKIKNKKFAFVLKSYISTLHVDLIIFCCFPFFINNIITNDLYSVIFKCRVIAILDITRYQKKIQLWQRVSLLCKFCSKITFDFIVCLYFFFVFLFWFLFINIHYSFLANWLPIPNKQK